MRTKTIGSDPAHKFLILGLVSLLAGVFAGCLGATQYLLPEFLKDWIPFQKMRPLHVSLIIGWIVFVSTGAVYYFIPRVVTAGLFSVSLVRIHLWLFALTGVGIIVSLLFGHFGGREYLEFAPLFMIPLILSWIIFSVNLIASIAGKVKKPPVYLWMWVTGSVFFVFTLTESQLHLLPHFGGNIVRNITVQWKSYGAMVGSWNMLVYGIAAFLMAKTGGDKQFGRGFLPFFMYGMGLFNLLFGWAHHTYIVPASDWLRIIAYGSSMTELVVLGILIMKWRKVVQDQIPEHHKNLFRFMTAADFWIVVNLVIAILMSIPAINFFTHGTHITVAHAMGTTIGINTPILFGALYFIFQQSEKSLGSNRLVKSGCWIFHISLIIFVAALLIMGVIRSGWIYAGWFDSFREMQSGSLVPTIIFLFSGIGVLTGLFLISMPVLRMYFIRTGDR
jgi:nitric oxide reductase subunit B